MPDSSSFIRSIRIRYVSGLLIFALASFASIYALNDVNRFRHQVDRFGADLVKLSRDLRNATTFAGTTTTAWRLETRKDLTAAAGGHAHRLNALIDQLSGQLSTVRSGLSVKTANELGSASVNGDLFWSARDIVRNLGVLAGAQTMDEWSYREIRNQNDLFAQPALIRARTARKSVV